MIQFELPTPPLGARVKMFLHSLRCPDCRVQFWAMTAVEFSSKSLHEASKGFETKRVSLKAKVYLTIAKFASKRRRYAQYALGMPAYEDMSPEQQAAVRQAVLGGATKAIDELRSRLH